MVPPTQAPLLPAQAVTLEVSQIEDLSRHFSSFRHDVNGCLSLIVAATELIRYNPDVVKRMSATLAEQPPRIAGKIREFVEQCERTLGIRDPADPAWYPELSKRANLAPAGPETPISVTPEQVKAVHNELLQLGKELTQMAFIVSGGPVLMAADPACAEDVAGTAASQLAKVSRKFDQLAEKFESGFQASSAAPRRMMSGTPSGPMTLQPDQVALFHRRLTNLRRDLVEHLGPLLELGRLARNDPRAVQERAAEFAQQPPNISSEIAAFATEFDRFLGIVRQS